jgi:hypothetical protein
LAHQTAIGLLSVTVRFFLNFSIKWECILQFTVGQII